MLGLTGVLHAFIKALLSKEGPVAQLGERLVRNEEVVGSIPIRSTTPN
jgi:hypothetical protein